MDDELDLSADGWMSASIGALWFCGACYALMALVLPMFFVLPLTARGNGELPKEVLAVTIGASLLLFGVAAGCAAGNFFVAWGLKKRKKWAWVGAVIVGALYAPSGCLPFGLLLLYAMLRSGVKEAYEAEARAAVDAPVQF